MMRTMAERCRPIELLVLDVDGVLTEGSITYQAGESLLLEQKSFHVRDGAGLAIWHRRGKQSAVITGRSSRVVDKRAAELGIGHVVQGSMDKRVSLSEMIAHLDLQPEQVACIGDDVPDLSMLRTCGLAVAVADACPEVVGHAHYVTAAAGGRGAVREMIERILRCQGLWDS